MQPIQLFTIAANNYLPKVRVLFKSIRKHHPEWAINLLLVDKKNNSIGYDDLLADKIWELSDLDIPNLTSWMFGHTIVELATAVKPFVAGKLFSLTGCQKVLYFDPDIVLFSRLDDLVERLNEFNIVLTPHQTVPDNSLEAIIDNEVCSLKHGIFNLGFLGLSSSKTTDEFIKWWSKRLYHLCEADFSRGLFTDQKWIDLVPTFFSGVYILKSDRFNVATWNLTNRFISLDQNGNYLVNNLPLGFYHFSGFDSGDMAVMAMKNGGHNLALKKLVLWYSAKVRSKNHDSEAKQLWSFGCFSNGLSISVEQRKLYKNRRDLQIAFPDPFEAHQYLDWWNSSHNHLNQTAKQPISQKIAYLRTLKNMFFTALLYLSKGEFSLLTQKIYSKFRKVKDKAQQDDRYALCRFLRVKPSNQQSQESSNPTDIIIPIFNGYDFVKKLLDSIEENTAQLSYRLLLVDDASSEEYLSHFLAEFSHQKNNVVLIKNDENLGFVASVNKAFSYVKSDFFVLLNSDTQVPSGWLPRLLDPLLKDPKVASTTPFSNSGSLNSFPYVNKNNQLFNEYSIDIIDEAFKSLPRLNQQIVIPTGVGFCMGIRTDLAKSYGFLDPAYGRGYGEENDWCLRLRQHGYNHVLTENLFVYHRGSSSFDQQEKEDLIDSNLLIIKSRYPLYEQEIAHYFAHDPASFICDFVKLKLLSKEKNISGAVLIVDHDMGGGANYYRNEEVKKYVDKQVPVLVLVEYEGLITIKVFTQEGNFRFSIPSLGYLDLIFDQIKISELIYNNLVGAKYPLDVVNAILSLRKTHHFRLSYLLHDYFSICPSFRLVNEEGRYCEASIDLVTCENCLCKQSIQYCDFVRPNENISVWRETWERLLNSSDQVVAFSAASKKILTKVYPHFRQNAVIVRPHNYPKHYLRPIKNSKKSNFINIGIIGGINYAKGGDIVNRLFYLINRNDFESVSLSIIGESGVDLDPNFLITGRYSRDSLVNTVESLGINIFLMPSIWPETYSYVADEMIAMNLPIVCFNVGAQAEKISIYNKGLVLDLDITTIELLNKIQGHLRRCESEMTRESDLVME
jgi:GT2 family glycosyltransferase/glycosyltransferase involved in cell wall biosynthesis